MCGETHRTDETRRRAHWPRRLARSSWQSERERKKEEREKEGEKYAAAIYKRFAYSPGTMAAKSVADSHSFASLMHANSPHSFLSPETDQHADF